MGFFDILGVLGLLVILILIVQLFRIAISDCDLGLQGRKLKREYFSGKVVWLVGATGGIGEQLCYQLSHVGAKMVLSDLPNRAMHMEGLITQFASPESAKIVEMDLTKVEGMESVVRDASSAFGHIDILILAAGVTQFESLVATPVESDRRIMDINFNGQRELIRQVLSVMTPRRKGHIVGIGSVSGKVGLPMQLSYAASKFALVGFLEGLRYELNLDNIHVTMVCPGAVDTSILLNAVQGNGMADSHPVIVGRLVGNLKRFSITPSRCAELTLIALSNELEEVWIGKLPFLGILYVHQYLPSICSFLLKRIDTKRLMKE